MGVGGHPNLLPKLVNQLTSAWANWRFPVVGKIMVRTLFQSAVSTKTWQRAAIAPGFALLALAAWSQDAMALSANCAAFSPAHTTGGTNAQGMPMWMGILNAPLELGEVVTIKVRNNGTADARVYIAPMGGGSDHAVTIAHPLETVEVSYTTDAAAVQNGMLYGVEATIGYTEYTYISGTCSIASPASGPTEDTGAQIQQQQQVFLQSRASMLVANAPASQRRIARINGAPATGSLESQQIMNYVQSLATGSMPIHGSLAAIEALDSDAQEPNRFDVWIDGTFSLFEANGGNGRSSAMSIGADYLLTPDLLVGGFVSIDNLDRFEIQGDILSGIGWVSGPYATVRLNDNVYLDMLAGLGTSSNKVASGGSVDEYGSFRWLVDASLDGSWTSGDWTFAPRLTASYAQEVSRAYASSSGASIASISTGVGQIGAGPGLVHTRQEENIRQELSLRLDAIAQLAERTSLGTRVEGGMNLVFNEGATLGAIVGYSTFGSGNQMVNASVTARASF